MRVDEGIKGSSLLAIAMEGTNRSRGKNMLRDSRSELQLLVGGKRRRQREKKGEVNKWDGHYRPPSSCLHLYDTRTRYTGTSTYIAEIVK